MNTKQLSKAIGELFRLRPRPLQVDTNGTRLPPCDDQWRLDSVAEQPARIRLTNVRTSHTLELESDNIQERRSPDFLLLRCQVILKQTGLELEPISKGAPIQPEPVIFGSVVESLKDVPMASRNGIKEGLVGSRLVVTGKMGSVRPDVDGLVRVGIMEDSGEDVFFTADPKRYPKLGLVRGGEPVEASGLLQSWGATVELDDAELRFR
jgi:hypothetical protein